VTHHHNDSRRGLQWALRVLAATPMASAIGEIVRGPQGVPGGSPDVAPTVDSCLRYANVFKFAVGPVIWSQLARIEQSPAVTLALSTIFVGGRRECVHGNSADGHIPSQWRQ
jgi:hypothetical protein